MRDMVLKDDSPICVNDVSLCLSLFLVSVYLFVLSLFVLRSLSLGVVVYFWGNKLKYSLSNLKKILANADKRTME